MKNIISMAVVAIVALVVGGGSGFFARGFLAEKERPWEEVAAEEVEQKEEEHSEEKGHGEGGETAKLAPFLVNLASEGRTRFLRMTLHLALAPDGKESLSKEEPRIRDAVLMLLGNKRPAELLSTEGKTHLRQEIIEHINSTVGKEMVMAVYFVDFLVQ